MIAHPTFRERLPSAIAATLLQVGMLALLVLSFRVVRHISEEEEHVISLPPLERPAQQNRMVVTPRRKPQATTPPPVTAPLLSPDIVSPEAATGNGGAGAGIQLAQPPAAADCRPENYVRLNGTDRATCAPLPDRPRNDRELAINPNPPVKNAPIWQSEIERRNTPPRVPCVSLQSSTLGMGGFAKQDFGAGLDVGCVFKVLRDGGSLLPPVRGDLEPEPPRAHASDAAFAKALQATNTRMRRLYAQPAPTAGAAR